MSNHHSFNLINFNLELKTQFFKTLKQTTTRITQLSGKNNSSKRKMKKTLFELPNISSMLLLAIILSLASTAASAASSSNMLENGCSAFDCKRSCIDSTRIRQTPGDNGFWFQIDGLRNNKYMPDKIYKGQSMCVAFCPIKREHIIFN